MFLRRPVSSQPTCRLYTHTNRVLQASMVALEAPESRFVSVIPKKLKNAMEKIDPSVAYLYSRRVEKGTHTTQNEDEASKQSRSAFIFVTSL